MKFTVRNIDFIYDGDGNIDFVTLRYNGNDGQGTTIDGSLRMTEEEYMSNSSNLKVLAELAKEKITEKLNSEV